MKAKKYCILGVVIICMVFTSCANEKQHNYSISTNLQILYNGEATKQVSIDGDMVELTLKVLYTSTVPFTLEVGLIDNFNQRPFEIENENTYLQDTIFEIKFPQTNGEFKESNIRIRVGKLKYDAHNLLFFIKNRMKMHSRSVRAYDFLRLNVNTLSVNTFELDKSLQVPFTPQKEENIFLELSPIVQKKAKRMDCELQFNIEKMYEGEKFIQEYIDHKNEEIEYVIMVLEDNKLLKINNQNQYVWSKNLIGQDGKTNFSLNSNTLDEKEIVFMLVPYPLLNMDTANRYQIMAYNSVCYYQYQFKESMILT